MRIASLHQRNAEREEQLKTLKVELQGRRRHKAFERLLAAGRHLNLNNKLIETAIFSIIKLATESDEDEAAFNSRSQAMKIGGISKATGTGAEAEDTGKGKGTDLGETSVEVDTKAGIESIEGTDSDVKVPITVSGSTNAGDGSGEHAAKPFEKMDTSNTGEAEEDKE